MIQPVTVLVSVAAACSVLAACAEGPQPTEQLAKARTLVEQADKAQAQRYAAADLQRARDELNSAEVANNKGSYDAARSYAESAAVDADVAAARAAAGEAQRAAHEAQQGNSTLQQESERAIEGGTPPAPPPARSDLQSYPVAPPAPAPEPLPAAGTPPQ